MSEKRGVFFVGAESFEENPDYERQCERLIQEIIPETTAFLEERFNPLHEAANSMELSELRFGICRSQDPPSVRVEAYCPEDLVIEYLYAVSGKERGDFMSSWVLGETDAQAMFEESFSADVAQTDDRALSLFHLLVGLRKAFSEIWDYLNGQLKAAGGLDMQLIGSPPELKARRSMSLSFSARPIRGWYTCPKCGLKVEETPDNEELSSGHVMCPRRDHGYVFFTHSVLGSHTLDDGIHRLPISREYYAIYRELLVHAKDEESFLTVSWERFEDCRDRIYVAVVEGRVVGYSQWNDDIGKRTARQVFVLPNFRHKGLGCDLIRVEGDLLGEFIAESPNDAGLAVLEKLGYVEEEEDGIRGVKCRFISGM